MNLIALETATDLCSVAIHHETTPVVELSLARPRAHAENLVPMIRDALRYAGLTPAELDAVVVSMGPGSYTGLRIGASTAKGLAVASGASLVGVPSLDALASRLAGIPGKGHFVCCAFNSRRDEVYAALYRTDEVGRFSPTRGPAALGPEDLAAFLGNESDLPLWLVGEGASRVARWLDTAGTGRFRLLDPARFRPSASAVARLGYQRVMEGKLEDVASFEPFYLKEFVAKKRSGSIFERLTF